MRQLFWLGIAIVGCALGNWAAKHLDAEQRRKISEQMHQAVQQDPELRAAFERLLR